MRFTGPFDEVACNLDGPLPRSGAAHGQRTIDDHEPYAIACFRVAEARHLEHGLGECQRDRGECRQSNGKKNLVRECASGTDGFVGLAHEHERTHISLGGLAHAHPMQDKRYGKGGETGQERSGEEAHGRRARKWR